MANDYIYLSGKAKWCRPHQADQWGNFKTQLYVDAKSKAEFQEWQKKGLASRLNIDEDGEWVNCKRPSQKVMQGRMVSFAPPEVLMADGETPFKNEFIGNGSDITCKMEIYEYRAPGEGKKKKAMRLQSIRVDNLVPFEKKSFDPDTEKLIRGMDEAPKPNYNF